jgi:glucosamine-6-phosphate deaminase
MKVIQCKDYDAVSQQAANEVEALLRQRPDAVLGLATGSTPIGLYEALVERHRQNGLDFSRVTTFNLDEYYPISPQNDQSYHFFMWKHLFGSVNIDPQRVHIPKGDAEDPDAACLAYEEALAAAGGIDLQILGIGNNGHIAFNEPAEYLRAATHRAQLTEDTIEANARFFDRPEDVPREAISMGMGSILKARRILLLACGEKKRRAVEEMLSGKITTQLPASFLNLHPDAILITDLEL